MAEFRNAVLSLGLALGALCLFACAQKSPEEKILEIRSRYSVEVNQSGFVATPRFPEIPVSEEGTEGEDGEGESVEEEMAAAMAEDLREPEGYDILLDLILSTSSRELVPQITVDIVHMDPSETVKSRWPVTMDTSKLLRGAAVQITEKIENVDYAEGDIFFAEIRSDVAVSERAKYPEFSGLP